MTKAAVIILAGTDGHANVGRLVNGLETAISRWFVISPGKSYEPVAGDSDH